MHMKFTCEMIGKSHKDRALIYIAEAWVHADMCQAYLMVNFADSITLYFPLKNSLYIHY